MKAAIIGTGWGARVQVPAFRQAGIEVVGIAGRRPERTRSVADDLSVEAFDDWRGLLESGADLISIVTPPHQHHEMAIASLEAGLQVLCEKPTALDAAQATAMLDAAQSRSGQLALIDHELRFLSTWQEARRRMSELRGIRHIEVRFSSPGRGDRSRAWNWWSDRELGGGVLGAVGSHFIDAIRYLTGDEIIRARGALKTTIAERPDADGHPREVTSDDTAFATLELAAGAVAELSLTVVAAVDEETTLTIHGEAGGMRLRGHVLEMAESGRWNLVQQAEEIESPGNTAGGPFGTGTHLIARALYGYAQGDRDTLAHAATFEDGLVQQRVLDCVRESAARGGAWVEVPMRSAASALR